MIAAKSALAQSVNLSSKFQLLELLGEGSFSSVFKVLRKEDYKVYALKLVRIAVLKPKDLQNCINEVRLLASFNSPFVIAYKEAIYDQSAAVLAIVMEFAGEGDLKSLIQHRKNCNAPFSEKEIWSAASHLLSALHDLHRLGVVHRDLKPANVFVSGGVFKVGDFNVSKVLREEMAVTQTGTPYYASPEIWRDRPYQKGVDVWSLGCILYEMALLRPPFLAPTMQELSQKILKGVLDKGLPKKLSPQLVSLVLSMLEPDPLRRPSAQALIRTPQLPKVLSHSNSLLLSTIRVPKNLNRLKEELPQQNYDQSRDREVSLPPIRRESEHRKGGKGKKAEWSIIQGSIRSERKRVKSKAAGHFSNKNILGEGKRELVPGLGERYRQRRVRLKELEG